MHPSSGRRRENARSESSRSRGIADGSAKISTIVTALVDTNVLVYRFDATAKAKQARAIELLRSGIPARSLRIAYQAVVEFHAAVTKPLAGRHPMLSPVDALRETEELLTEFQIIYPTEPVVRTALRGMAAYQLSWFDALMWAHAEESGIADLLSEGFQHDRMYGAVRVVNPFL